jgi:hypothetical protein
MVIESRPHETPTDATIRPPFEADTMSAPAAFDSRLVVTWTRATFVGWVLGVPVIAAMALLGEAMGIGGAQVFVGLGMGTSVGFMQGRVLRVRLDPAVRWPWFWSCALGLAAPFLIVDIADVMRLTLPYSLQASVALAGLLAGMWQRRLLAPYALHSGWWVCGSVVGFLLAAGMTAIADWLFRAHSFRGLWGAIAFLGIIAGGGLALGLVTGLTLAWVHRSVR